MSCTRAEARRGRHEWQFVKNVETVGYSRAGASFHRRGRYRCACGARKLGPMQHDGTDPLGAALGMTK